VKPHHALDAYYSLAMTTEWKTVCSAESNVVQVSLRAMKGIPKYYTRGNGYDNPLV